MNRRLKNQLFHEYEEEMNFKANLSKAKEGLSFSQKETKTTAHQLIPIFASVLTCVTIGFSVYSFLSQGEKSAFVSEDEVGIKANATDDSISSTYTFGKENEYTLSVHLNYPMIYFIDEKENMELKKLIVKEDDELLSVLKEEEHQVSYQLNKISFYQVTWEYETYSGTIE